MKCLRQVVSVIFVWQLLIGMLLAQTETDPTSVVAPAQDRELDELPPPITTGTYQQAALEVYEQPALEGYQQAAVDASQQPLIGMYKQQDPRSIWDLSAGASFYYLKPFSEVNTAYQRTTIVTGPVGNTSTAVGQTTTSNFDWNTQPAGAFWLGTSNENGLGLQSRFFFLGGNSQSQNVSLTSDQASSTNGTSSVTNVINPSPFTPSTFPGALPPVVAGSQSFSSPSQLLHAGYGRDDMNFRSTLKINAFDLEPTYGWKFGQSTLLVGSGLRYLQMTQTYAATLQNLGGGVASDFESLNLSNKFWGVGPTISGRFNRTLGTTGLKLFTSGRGSYLIGNSTRTATFTDQLNDPTGVTSGVNNTFVQRNSSIPTSTDVNMAVLDLELGLEYGKVIGNHYWYSRGAVVDQTYFNAGNASNTSGNLSLFGFQFSAGFDY